MPPDATLSPTPNVADAERSSPAAYDALKEAIAAEILKLQPGLSLPRADISQCSLTLLSLLADVLPFQPSILTRFSDAEQTTNILPFFNEGRRWALATFFVATNHAKTPHADNALRDLHTQGKPLRKRAFDTVRFLESLRLLPNGTTDALRAGTGYKDFASDCTICARHIRTHWDILEPVFQKQPEAERFTLSHLQTLSDIGDQMTLELGRADGTVPPAWRPELIACSSRLSALYEPWRHAAAYHFNVIQHPLAARLTCYIESELK